MKDVLSTLGFQVLAAVVGLLLCLWWLPGFSLEWSGFLVAVVVVVLAQAAFAPLAARVAQRHAPAFLGGTGLISSLLALLLAGLFPGGIRVSGAGDWILAALILWVATAAGAVVGQAVRTRRTRNRAHPAAGSV